MDAKNASLVVSGMGMVSALGLDVETGCAAARAGLDRSAMLKGTKLWDSVSKRPVPVTVHSVPGITNGFAGFGRLVRLGSLALKDFLRQTKGVSIDWSRTALLINLENSYYLEQRELCLKNALNDGDPHRRLGTGAELLSMTMQTREDYKKRLVPAILQHSGLNLAPALSEITFEGEVGTLALISKAQTLLKDSKLDKCIVGGIGTYLEEDKLEMLYDLNLLKGEQNPEGFIPGEAAVFMLLERSVRTSGHAKIQPRIGPLAIERETVHRFHDQPSGGIGLSKVIREVLGDVKSQDATNSIGIVAGNLNGERSRALEWGNALSRLPSSVSANWAQMWTPAVNFGETGPAYLGIALCMAITAFKRGYARPRHCLVWVASDNGWKGACVLDAL